MRLITHTPRTPEETIALDELLLKKAEEGEIGETLRFWEAEEYFIVVGRAGKTAEDCEISRCHNDGIKVIRRISGGGTVLQGPGCLNYSLILSYKENKEYGDINSSYCAILGGLAEELQKAGHNVKFMPISDLAIEGKKISGNAQARKRSFFLHHGTFMYDLDMEKVSSYLAHPVK